MPSAGGGGRSDTRHGHDAGDICGLADGNNWAIRTTMNKFRGEFEKRVKPTFVPVRMSVGAMAKEIAGAKG